MLETLDRQFQKPGDEEGAAVGGDEQKHAKDVAPAAGPQVSVESGKLADGEGSFRGYFCSSDAVTSLTTRAMSSCMVDCRLFSRKRSRSTRVEAV